MGAAPKPSLLKFYESLESDDVAGRADQLRALVREPGWTVFTEAVGIQRDQLVQVMTKGGARSRADYARKAGLIAGLDDSVETVEKILEFALRTERDAREAAERGDEEEQHG